MEIKPMAKKNIINKKVENKEKRKYEFKSEKTKKKILISCLFGLAVALIVIGISMGGLKAYNSLHKNNEGLTKNASKSGITIVSYTGTNGGVTINNRYYAKGINISASTVGSNVIYGNSNGKTNLKIMVNFAANIANPRTVGMSKQYNYFKLQVYKNDGSKGWASSCTKITQANKNTETTLYTNLGIQTGLYKEAQIEVYTNASCGGTILTKEKIAMVAPAPKITSTISKNSNKTLISSLTSGTTEILDDAIHYNINFKVENKTKQTVYYRFFKYNSTGFSNLSYNTADCWSIASGTTKTFNPGLDLNSSNPKQMVYARIYTSQGLCKNDNKAKYSNSYSNNSVNNYISSFIAPIKLNKVFNEDGWKKISFDKNIIETKIGTQDGWRGKKPPNCKTYAQYYANYIINGTIKSASSKGNSNASSYSSLYNKIKQEISAGKPVVIHVRSSRGEHWVTVTEYNNNIGSVSKWEDLLKNITVLDPYSNKCGYSSKKAGCLYHGVASSDSIIKKMYNTTYVTF